MTSLTRILLAVILAMIGLAGLLMSLCGGLFTIAIFHERHGQYQNAGDFWFAVMTLIAGIILVVVSLKYLLRIGGRGSKSYASRSLGTDAHNDGFEDGPRSGSGQR
jgi:hypothetical protein